VMTEAEANTRSSEMGRGESASPPTIEHVALAQETGDEAEAEFGRAASAGLFVSERIRCLTGLSE